MSDKCAYPKCGKELIHVQGRKKKKYCDASCKLADWQRLNPVKKEPKEKRISIAKWREIEEKLKESLGKAIQNGVNQANAAANQSGETSPLIIQYETELSNLGDGQFAKARKKWLTNKIYELKSKLK